MDNLVTVIISAFNGDKYLSQAIESVLAQEKVDFELIIVDDGSIDNTSKVIEQYLSPKVTSIWQSNQGQGAAFNHAIKLAKGQYIAFLDQDDIYFPNKLALQLDVLENMPEIDIVIGNVEQFISPELPEEIKASRKCPSQPMPGFLPSVVMFRKQCFDIVGLFNTTWKVGSGIDFYIRAQEKGLKTYVLTEVVLRRRIHDKNLTVVAREHYHNYLDIIKNKLNRAKMAEKQKWEKA